MLSMQLMRYINLLSKITGVRTRKCFTYNNAIIFAVPAKLISRAVGPSGKNVKELQEKLGKKIKVIKEGTGIDDAKRFVEDIVSPVGFVSLELKDKVFILTAGARSKAALLGRNKRRLEELKQIMEDNYGKGLKII